MSDRLLLVTLRAFWLAAAALIVIGWSRLLTRRDQRVRLALTLLPATCSIMWLTIGVFQSQAFGPIEHGIASGVIRTNLFAILALSIAMLFVRRMRNVLSGFAGLLVAALWYATLVLSSD